MACKQPVIKWSGSKRHLAAEIISYFPSFDLYFEPFLGGGSVLLELQPKKAICVDINESLIDFWNCLKKNPQKLAEEYEQNWIQLQKDWHYYLFIRDRYNNFHSGSDLLFLSRTCVNGLIRYNKKGEFNNSLHYSRKGVKPDSLRKLLLQTSKIIQNYVFLSGDYQQILPMVSSSSLIYLDPPYFNTKAMYYGKIDYEKLWLFLDEINHKNAKFILSFDGKSSNKDYFSKVPEYLVKSHILLSSGFSTFNKVIDKVQNKTEESLYLNYSPKVLE
jgi:DNA adenine methylase